MMKYEIASAAFSSLAMTSRGLIECEDTWRVPGAKLRKSNFTKPNETLRNLTQLSR